MKQNTWLRRTAGAVVVATAALAAPALTAAPAAAAPASIIDPDWVDGCPDCPGPVFRLQVEISYPAAERVTNVFRQGLSELIASSRAQDPASARRLHDTAVRTLAGGAAQAGNGAWVPVGPLDDLCPKRDWPYPGPKPHWDAVQRSIGDGMTLLGQVNRTGDGRTLAAAGRSLDAGVAGFTDFQGCV